MARMSTGRVIILTVLYRNYEYWIHCTVVGRLVVYKLYNVTVERNVNYLMRVAKCNAAGGMVQRPMETPIERGFKGSNISPRKLWVKSSSELPAVADSFEI